MPIEPQECRQNALQCRELAERAQRLAQAQIFLHLAKRRYFYISPSNGYSWPLNSSTRKPCGNESEPTNSGRSI